MLLAAADQPSADIALIDQVAGIVRQLDARELATRDEAERKLLDLGAAALPLLPQIDEDTPAEIALRVTRVQQKLLAAQAAAAAEPTLVTLHGADMPIAEVFEALSKQTGNSIHDHRSAFGEEPTELRVDVDFDKTPFWQAFDRVLDDAGLALYPFSGRRGAFVVNQRPGAGSRERAGLLRVDLPDRARTI